jgi:hypothetical protein
MIHWIKEHVGFSLWTFGTASRIIIDWNHIAERGIETAIVAFINGGMAALGGLIMLGLIKLFFPAWYSKMTKK